VAGKAYSGKYGYRNVTGGGKSKKKQQVTDETVMGFKRDDLSAIDKDFIEGAEYKYSFETPNSSMVHRVEYDPDKLLMRVYFVNRGDIVVYDHVPAETYYYLAHNARREGKIGHIFWDVIRYRGRLIGSKLPFYYENKSTAADNYDPAIYPWLGKMTDGKIDLSKKFSPKEVEQLAEIFASPTDIRSAEDQALVKRLDEEESSAIQYAVTKSIVEKGDSDLSREMRAKKMIMALGGKHGFSVPSAYESDSSYDPNFRDAAAEEAHWVKNPVTSQLRLPRGAYSKQQKENRDATLQMMQDRSVDPVTGLTVKVGSYQINKQRRLSWKYENGMNPAGQEEVSVKMPRSWGGTKKDALWKDSGYNKE
jgi:hypothetical protein